MTSDPRSALPPGFEGFGAEVFERQAPPRVEEPWRTRPPLRGLRPGDRVVVGRQAYEVIRPFSDYEVMAQKPGAKRKAFNVWQNGPTVEVREQRGSSETTMAEPVIASAPFDQVRTTRTTEANHARARGLTPRAWRPTERGIVEVLSDLGHDELYLQRSIYEKPWQPWSRLAQDGYVDATEDSHDSVRIRVSEKGYDYLRNYRERTGQISFGRTRKGAERDRGWSERDERPSNRARVTLSTSASEWPGLSRGRSIASFDQRQLRRGAEVEREHVGGNTSLAMRIAADHLVEDPRYYEKLARMEGANEARGRSEVVERAVEALRLYYGSNGTSPRDQERLASRARRAVESVASRYGADLADVYRQVEAEARARGPRMPVPGKDY